MIISNLLAFRCNYKVISCNQLTWLMSVTGGTEIMESVAKEVSVWRCVPVCVLDGVGVFVCVWGGGGLVGCRDVHVLAGGSGGGGGEGGGGY